MTPGFIPFWPGIVSTFTSTAFASHATAPIRKEEHMHTDERIAAGEMDDGVTVTERHTHSYEARTIATVKKGEDGILLYVGAPANDLIMRGAIITLSPSQAQHLARLLLAKAV